MPLTQPAQPESAAEFEVVESPGNLFDGPWETWDAYFLGDQHVGYAHVAAERAGERTDSDVRYQLDSLLLIQTGSARLTQRLTQTSIETNDGRVVGFEGTLHVGPAVTRYHGAMVEGELQVVTTRGSSRTTTSIPWKPTYRGLVALEQSLRDKPMKDKDERRTLKMLLPRQYRLATVRLRCRGEASVPLIDGTMAKLLEIDCEIRIDDGEPAYSTIWTDGSGEIVRTYSPTLGLIAYRTDQSTATDLASPPVAALVIPVAGKTEGIATSRRAAYVIKPTQAARRSGEPIGIPSAPGQSIRRLNDGFQVLVSREDEPRREGFERVDLEPSEADLQPNHFIDSNATLVRRLAQAAVASRELSPRETALELTRTVSRMMGDDAPPLGLVKASQAARDGVGDSTARAVLLAALLRARNIPSRVAVGLRFSEPGQMSAHLWTLAHVDGSWLHLDANGQGVAAADRLIFSTTDLAGGNEYDAMRGLLDEIGRIEIQVVGIRG